MGSKDWHRFELVNEQPTGRGMVVRMDGKQLQGVRFVGFAVGVNDANVIVLEMFAQSINADVVGEAEGGTDGPA